MKRSAYAKQVRDPEMSRKALVDCYARFINVCPQSLKEDELHLMFEVEEAWWWYKDEWQEKNQDRLPRLKFHEFVERFREEIKPMQKLLSPNTYALCKKWRQFCAVIPLFGGVVCDQELQYCLM
eukprot:Cvel_22147.t1-p1 / transcript=Cvel_22147.t1 / gene=Cvel_22147 / organism=Chromera_velia_CCMP2878 / gene_product=hypothetical protein / transcript_product=hypothetical protein / location=Cvel_scaffold2148:30558-32835(+) / protein_length=123 / sequence_SO=supercontig / SO=protein_coding / is_pseudo=false